MEVSILRVEPKEVENSPVVARRKRAGGFHIEIEVFISAAELAEKSPLSHIKSEPTNNSKQSNSNDNEKQVLINTVHTCTHTLERDSQPHFDILR